MTHRKKLWTGEWLDAASFSQVFSDASAALEISDKELSVRLRKECDRRGWYSESKLLWDDYSSLFPEYRSGSNAPNNVECVRDLATVLKIPVAWLLEGYPLPRRREAVVATKRKYELKTKSLEVALQ